MTQSLRKPYEDAAFDQLISQMDLEQVKRMMCPKSRGNPKACLECVGFRTCQAGQRAVRLVDEETKTIEKNTASVFVRKWTEGKAEEHKPPRETPAAASRPTLFKTISTDRDVLKEACESGNAWQWIMENYQPDKNKAQAILEKLIRECPGIAADYGGSRRIMQRPKVVNITSVAAKAETVAEEPKTEAAGAKTEQKVTETDQTALTDFNRQQKEEARERCRKAIESGDPVRFLMDAGSSEETARRQVRKWIDRYPDLCDGFVLEDKKRGRKKKADVPAEETETDEPEAFALEDPEDDEVSLLDFLNEYEVEPEEDQPEEQPQQQTGDSMLDGMRAKYNELESEKKKLTEQIRKIEAQQEALKKCIDVFR